MVRAGDALTTGLVDRTEAGVAGHGLAQLRADEAGPGVGAAALGEGDEHLEGLAGIVAVFGGCGRVEQVTAEQIAGGGEHGESTHDGEGGTP